MKLLFRRLVIINLLASASVIAQTYTNYIRQYQMPSGVTWDAESAVTASGSRLSALPINPGGARFDLWTIASSTTTGLTSYLIDSNYVGTYVPIANVVVRSEDTTGVVPRTRADRPFYVDITTSGMLSGATDPEPSKSVKFLRHVQSYGIGGTGIGIDRTQATLLSQNSINTNGSQTQTYLINSIPAADRAKVRGEERFSIFSLEDYQSPEAQLASQYIQVWPVADAVISGIAEGDEIRFAAPAVTFTLTDLYPQSATYAQLYKGAPQLNMTGAIIPGSSVVIAESIPQNRQLTASNYDSLITSDGIWTMELVTVTPFGIDRLSAVSFEVDRTIEVRSFLTTSE